MNRLARYVTAATIVAGSAHAAPLSSTTATTTFHKTDVNGVSIFYREAGPARAATILLFHGFPSSSREFDTLIPFLATRYHVIAPDYPGFGLSDAPPPSSYGYTFDHLSRSIDALLDKLRISRCTMYLHDYGAPIGMRMIMTHPSRLEKLIVQNGNVYQAGLGPKWTKIASTGPSRKLILRCWTLFFPLRILGNDILPAPRIQIDTTQIHGTTSSPPCRGPVSVSSRETCFTTTGPTSPYIPSGSSGSVIISLQLWSSGARTIHRSSPPAPWRFRTICRAQRSTCWKRGTSLWTNRQIRSRN